MYPDLSYLFHDLLGSSPDNWLSVFKTFGLMLVLAILAGSQLLYLELRRKAREGLFQPEKVKEVVGRGPVVTEIVSNAVFGFIFGAKLLYIFGHFEEFKANAAGVLFSLKGSLGGGILLALVYAAYRYWQGKKEQLPKPKTVVKEVYPHDRIGEITIIAAVSGIVGAKIFDMIEHLDAFFADPLGVFFSGSGLAIYGGLIGGFLGVSWFLRKHKIPIVPVLDAVAPALMIAYGIGRIGCQLSGDGDWGIVAGAMPEHWFLPDWMWSFNYPHNVAQEGVLIEGCTSHYCRVLPEGVYPTPFYETVLAFLIGGFLWAIRKRVHIGGMLFFIYLTLNGIERFFIERIRVNPHYDVLGFSLSQAQLIAIGLFVIGVAGMGYLYVRRRE